MPKLFFVDVLNFRFLVVRTQRKEFGMSLFMFWAAKIMTCFMNVVSPSFLHSFTLSMSFRFGWSVLEASPVLTKEIFGLEPHFCGDGFGVGCWGMWIVAVVRHRKKLSRQPKTINRSFEKYHWTP